MNKFLKIFMIILFSLVCSKDLFAQQTDVHSLIWQAISENAVINSKTRELVEKLNQIQPENPSQKALKDTIKTESDVIKEINTLSGQLRETFAAIKTATSNSGIEDLKELLTILQSTQERFQSIQRDAEKDLTFYEANPSKNPERLGELKDIVATMQSHVSTMKQSIEIVEESIVLLEKKPPQPPQPTQLPTFEEYLKIKDGNGPPNGVAIAAVVRTIIFAETGDAAAIRLLQEKGKYRKSEFSVGKGFAKINITNINKNGDYTLPSLKSKKQWFYRGYVTKYNRVYSQLYAQELEVQKQDLIEEGKIRAN